MPAANVPQQLLHCIFVTTAAGFDSVPGMYIPSVFLLFLLRADLR